MRQNCNTQKTMDQSLARTIGKYVYFEYPQIAMKEALQRIGYYDPTLRSLPTYHNTMNKLKRSGDGSLEHVPTPLSQTTLGALG